MAKLSRAAADPMLLKRPESVLVVMYNEHNKVLVLQRDDDPTFWQSVTGSLEDDEVPIQTALREVLEETGVDILANKQILADCRLINQYVIRKDWRHRYAPGISTNFEYVFCVQIPADSSIVLTEHLQYLWLDKAEAINKVWSVSNKLAIETFVPASKSDV